MYGDLYQSIFIIHNKNLARNESEKNLINEYNDLLKKYNKFEYNTFADNEEILRDLTYEEFLDMFDEELLGLSQITLQEEIEKFLIVNKKELHKFLIYEKEYYRNILLIEKYKVNDDNVYIDTYHENYNLLVDEYNPQVDEVNKIIKDYLEYFIIEYNNKDYLDVNNFFIKLSSSDLYYYYLHNNENDAIFHIDAIVKYIKQKFNDVYSLKEKILYYKNKIDIQEKRLKMVNHNNCYEYNDCYAKDISNYRSWDNEDYNWTFDPQ